MTHSNLYSVPGNGNVNIISWNVKGLNNAVQRKKGSFSPQYLGVGIAFLQENHLRCKDHLNFKSRGATILIHQNVPFIFQYLRC